MALTRGHRHVWTKMEHCNDALMKCMSVCSVKSSRNFCTASSMDQSSIFRNGDEAKKKEFSSTKMTELYNKQLQYRNILSRENATTFYRKNDETKRIGKCKHINELKELYTELHDKCCFTPQIIPIFDVYVAFMEKSIELDPEFFWEMFAELKGKFLHPDCVYRSKDLCVGKLFNTAMLNVVKTSVDTKHGIKKMFEIYDEFKTLCNDESNTWSQALPYYPLTLTRLISCCIMTSNYGKAKQIIDSVFEHKETLLYDKRQQSQLWNSILNYYAKTQDLESMEVYFKKMTDEYGVEPNDVTFSIRMNAFAKSNDMRFERIFADYIQTFNRYPQKGMFLALLNGYSINGDIASLLDVLKLLLNRDDANAMASTLPPPNFMIFVPVFKALLQKDAAIKCDYGWTLVEYLFSEMEKVNVKPNEIIYGMVFSYCGTSFFEAPDMDKLMFYYKQMTETYNLKPQRIQFRNLLKSGVQYYQYMLNAIESEDGTQRENITQEKQEFVKWWKQEMNKYNVEMNNDFRSILLNNACN
eukprot:122904_1